MSIYTITELPFTSCPLCGSRVAIIRDGLVCSGRNLCLWSAELFASGRPPLYNMGVVAPFLTVGGEK